MRRIGVALTVLVACGFALAACSKKSGVGESCQKDDDCSGSLRCMDLTCVPKAEAWGKCRKSDDCSGSLACIDKVCVDTALPGLAEVLASCWVCSDPRCKGAQTRFVHQEGQRWEMWLHEPTSKLDIEVSDRGGRFEFMVPLGDKQLTIGVRPIDYATIEFDEKFWRKMYGKEDSPLRLTRTPCATPP